MTNTNPRSLIRRLADDLEGITEELVIPEYAHTEKERTDASLALVAEARAYLALPEPEVPTEEKLREMWLGKEWFNEGATYREFASISHAALARWGK